MTLETATLAGGDIEVTFLQQTGRDPFTTTPERSAQVSEVAGRIARFIGEARATLDIAIYDFRLRDDSLGKRAGPGGKDLGADVDRIGPGKAYEEWKKTDDYKAWRRQVEDLMAQQ